MITHPEFWELNYFIVIDIFHQRFVFTYFWSKMSLYKKLNVLGRVWDGEAIAGVV